MPGVEDLGDLLGVAGVDALGGGEVVQRRGAVGVPACGHVEREALPDGASPGGEERVIRGVEPDQLGIGGVLVGDAAVTVARDVHAPVGANVDGAGVEAYDLGGESAPVEGDDLPPGDALEKEVFKGAGHRDRSRHVALGLGEP